MREGGGVSLLVFEAFFNTPQTLCSRAPFSLVSSVHAAATFPPAMTKIPCGRHPVMPGLRLGFSNTRSLIHLHMYPLLWMGLIPDEPQRARIGYRFRGGAREGKSVWCGAIDDVTPH